MTPRAIILTGILAPFVLFSTLHWVGVVMSIDWSVVP